MRYINNKGWDDVARCMGYDKNSNTLFYLVIN